MITFIKGCGVWGVWTGFFPRYPETRARRSYALQGELYSNGKKSFATVSHFSCKGFVIFYNA